MRPSINNYIEKDDNNNNLLTSLALNKNNLYFFHSNNNNTGNNGKIIYHLKHPIKIRQTTAPLASSQELMKNRENR